jgi:hypothetical protein
MGSDVVKDVDLAAGTVVRGDVNKMITYPIASKTRLGCVIVGDGISVTDKGTESVEIIGIGAVDEICSL